MSAVSPKNKIVIVTTINLSLLSSTSIEVEKDCFRTLSFIKPFRGPLSMGKITTSRDGKNNYKISFCLRICQAFLQ